MVESGDKAGLAEARAALPTLNRRVLARFAAVDQDVDDPVARATGKRLVMLLSEVSAHEARRRGERRKAEQRRRDCTTRIERTVELAAKCARCGSKVEDMKTTGRLRIY